jgi:hypothetical protein
LTTISSISPMAFPLGIYCFRMANS